MSKKNSSFKDNIISETNIDHFRNVFQDSNLWVFNEFLNSDYVSY